MGLGDIGLRTAGYDKLSAASGTTGQECSPTTRLYVFDAPNGEAVNRCASRYHVPVMSATVRSVTTVRKVGRPSSTIFIVRDMPAAV